MANFNILIATENRRKSRFFLDFCGPGWYHIFRLICSIRNRKSLCYAGLFSCSFFILRPAFPVSGFSCISILPDRSSALGLASSTPRRMNSSGISWLIPVYRSLYHSPESGIQPMSLPGTSSYSVTVPHSTPCRSFTVISSSFPSTAPLHSPRRHTDIPAWRFRNHPYLENVHNAICRLHSRNNFPSCSSFPLHRCNYAPLP